MNNFLNPQICVLCRTETYFSTFYFLQEQIRDGFGTGQLRLGSTSNALSDALTLRVHVGCWGVAERALPCTDVSQRWIHQFSMCVINLTPSLAQVPFSAEVGELDLDIYQGPEHHEKLRRGSRLPGNLSNELIQMVYSFLDQEEDVVHLSEVIDVQPIARHWERLGYKYMMGPTPDVEADIRALVYNITSNPSSYPQTINYKVVWNNAMMVAAAMESPPPVVQISNHERFAYAVISHRCLPQRTGRFALPTRAISHLTFVFNGLALCGIVVNGRLFGQDGSVYFTALVNGLKGLNIAIFDSYMTAVQLKDADGWQSYWHGSTTPVPLSSAYCRLEWDSLASELVIGYDDNQLIELACRNDTAERTLYPTQDPVDPTLSFVPLYDRHKRRHGLSPLQTFTTDLGQITGVSAFFNLRSPYALTGLELMCRDKVHFLGIKSTYAVKLAFPLLPKEMVTNLSVSRAVDDGSLTLEFTTDKHRSVIFGDPAVEVLYSIGNITGIATGRSLLEEHISIFGVFQNAQNPIVHISRPDSYVQRQFWSSTVVFSPESRPSPALQSTASLGAIFRITAYEDNGPILGLLLEYENDCTSALGELVGETISHDLHPGGTIQDFVVSYKITVMEQRVFSIGLLIEDHWYDFGERNLEHSVVHSQKKDETFLCWTFSSSFSELSFSMAAD